MASSTANSLVKDGMITKINSNVYEVQSGTKCYPVCVLKDSIWCDAGSCMGFRFRQDCKHCKAVAIFADLDVEPIVPTKAMREAILKNKTVAKPVKKAKKTKKAKPDQVETISESQWVRARDYQ